MSVTRSPFPETRPLLDQRPTPSNNSTNDVNLLTGDSESLPTITSSRISPWILAGLWIGSMLAAFDGTVASTLLTPIGSKFNASHRSSFIGSSYLLSMCCFTPLYGRLADNLGRKRSLLLALSLFGLGNMWCGMAQSMNSVIAGRVIAGMGGGGLPTVAGIIITDLAEPTVRGIYQGGSNIAFGLGAGLGGSIGGWINDTLGWRWAFYIQAPVVIIGFVVVAVNVNIPLSDEPRHRTLIDKLRQMDFLGSVVLTGAFGCFFLAVNFGAADEMEWTQPLVVLLFALSAFLTFSFVMIEKYWAPDPLLASRLILRWALLPIYISNFFLSMSASSMLYIAPIFCSIVRSHPSAVTGLYLVPHSIFVPTGAIFAAWYTRKIGKLYSMTLHAACLVVLPSLLASLWNKNTPEYHLWLNLLPQAVGFSCFVTTTIIAMMVNVRKEDHPMGFSTVYLVRTTGNATGVSLGGAILQSVLLQKLHARINGPGSEKIIYSIRHSAEIIPSLEPFLRHAAIESYADALRVVFMCQFAVGVLGILPCLLISDRPPTFDRQPERERESNSP